MMRFQRLTSADDALFEEAFALYGVGFPEHERRDGEKQRALMANPLYHFDAIMDGGTFAGIMLYWLFPRYAYIEHFAIHPDRRGKSLGSGSLRLFCRRHEPVILEIDPPVDAVSVRRESFYKRLGFAANSFDHAHPAYRRSFPPHRLVVMSHPRSLTEGEYGRFAGDLAAVVMADAESA